MKTLIAHKARNKRIVLVGFGKEGQSTLGFLLRSELPNAIAIADQNIEVQKHPLIISNQITFIGGKDFETELCTDDFIIKSPGVKLQKSYPFLSSQTALFMECYGKQIIGISGTKGKSTTATMAYRMLQTCGKKALLVGNIGIPPFEAIEQIEHDSLIVEELSAHQLAAIPHSCRYAILLNLMPEHLDFFGSIEHYYKAKLRLFSQQDEDKAFRYVGNSCLPYTSYRSTHPHSEAQQNTLYISGGKQLREEDLKYLHGKHHLENISALIDLAFALKLDINCALNAIKPFKPLAHRQEFIDNGEGCQYIDDSISTVPQATIAALNSFPQSTHLILGGVDRGIKYDKLLSVLQQRKLKRCIFWELQAKGCILNIQNYTQHPLLRHEQQKAYKTLQKSYLR